MTLDFTQVDVFSSRRLEGNSLAVFHQGRGLSAARMQAIAREMNLSETTFVFPTKKSDEADAAVRIFTVREELPFAGHPTLGTAFVVAKSRPKQTEIRLRLKAGVIPVSVKRKGEQAYLEMRQKDPVFRAEVPDKRRLSEVIGLDVADLDPRYRPQVVSTGLPFLITPLASRSALERLRPNWKLLTPMLEESGAHFPYHVVTGEKELEARMLTPDFEDPATGSAAGCAAAYLVRYGICKPDSRFSIRQGRLMQRPSRIYASASLTGDQVHNVRVGGNVVEVLRGRMRL